MFDTVNPRLQTVRSVVGSGQPLGQRCLTLFQGCDASL